MNGRHCGRTHCQCTHEDPCLRGWRDYDDGGRGFTAPCRVCRPDAWEVTAKAPTREAMQSGLQNPARRTRNPYGGT